MDVERVIGDGNRVGAAALRAYLVWAALFASSGVRDGSPAIGWLAAGCIALALAFIGSLVFLVWREVHG
jgi:hypothetical protein